jgi:hypothetical protein
MKEKGMTKLVTPALVFAITVVFIFILPPNITGQSTYEARTIEIIKKLSAEIDQFVKDHEDPDRKFIARKFPIDHSSREDTWEWKEMKSWDETDAYFKDYWSFLSVGVHIKDSLVVYVHTGEWSDSGDWAFYVSYYYDDKGRLLQIATDYRTLVDDIKILDFQYFNDSGQVVEHTVEYYALGWGGNQKLSEKPEHMESPINDIPVYLRVSDLPFYSLLKTKPTKGNILLGENAWRE